MKIIIDLYRETEFLWYVRYIYYKNVSKRSLALKSIAEDLLSKGYDFSPEELKKKIHSLRISCNKTNKKVKESMKSGARLNCVFLNLKTGCMKNFVSSALLIKFFTKPDLL